MVSENVHDAKSLFRLIDSSPIKKKRYPLHEAIPETVLVEEFSNICRNKVNLIHQNLELLKPMNEHVPIDQKKYETMLSCFSVVTEDNVMKILQKSPRKSCNIDHLPTWLHLKCKLEIIPIISHFTNLSIGLSHISLKSTMVIPMLKACNLSLLLKNYRLVLTLKFISKSIECIIAVQLHDDPLQNSILEQFHHLHTVVDIVRRRHWLESQIKF